ncbi:MAG: transcriptional regulator [Burkholderiaceae bacterium]|nr:transcriptional regulator [Burkholderiaceae bacterium]
MEIRPIHTDADYKAALREISTYFDNEPEPGTPDGDRFEILLTLVEAYEARHFPIDLPDPVEAIKFRMEQAGLTPKDPVPAIGRLNRVYEILARKRPLTLNMIWRLHERFGIPAESLIRPPGLSASDR